jgi:hypothetical protein
MDAYSPARVFADPRSCGQTAPEPLEPYIQGVPSVSDQ